MIDLHHHILPGLDDGPATMDESLAMCRRAAAEGIDTLVATPHMLDGVFGVTAERVREGVRELNRRLESEWEGPSGPEHRRQTSGAEAPSHPSSGAEAPSHTAPRILPGADVHLHEDLLAKIRGGEVLTVNDTGAYVLLELPPTVLPSRLGGFLFQMLAAGVRPILTHPERHAGIASRAGELEAWVERGGLVQVTAGAFLGRFGAAAQEAAERWARGGLVHAIATDGHPMPGREGGLAGAAARLEALAGAGAARRIVRENPERIIQGKGLE